MVRGRAAQRVMAVAAALTALAAVPVMAPSAARAAVCGPGTFYDAPSDSCLVVAAESAPLPPAPPPAAPPPPAPPPPPAWNAPTPWVSASICAPIPIVNLCVGV